MTEEHPTYPSTVYGSSKLAGECYARAYHATYGYPTVVVRPFNTYGPRSHHEGDSGEVIPKFMLRCLAGRPLVVFGDGSQTRDFTYVSDSAAGILLAGEDDRATGQTFNLGFGAEVTIADLAARIGGEEDIKAIDQQQAAAVAAINGRFQNIPLTVTAGPHKIGVTFIARTFAESDDVLFVQAGVAAKIGWSAVAASKSSGRSPLRPQRHAEPSARLRLPSEDGGQRSCRARRGSFRRWRTAPSVVRSRSRISTRRCVLRRPRGGRFRRRHPGRAAGDSRQPEVPVSRRAHAGRHGRRAPRTASPISSLASRLSFFLLEPAPDDELLAAGGEGHARRADGARRAGASPAGRSAVTRRWSPTSRSSG